MKITTLHTLTLSTLLFLVSHSNVLVAEVVKPGATQTDAVILKKDPPGYPDKALREGIEGWVILNYTVKDDGTTDSIVVIDASIEGYFERRAINAVAGWIYQPATLNGEPVSEGNRTARTTFFIKDRDKGVTRRFRTRYTKARKAIEQNDPATARVVIDELITYKKRLLTEVFYLDLVEFMYWQSLKDDKATLMYVERALVLADELAPEDIYHILLRQAVVYNAVAQNYQTALSHYETYQEEMGDIAAGDSVIAVVAQVRQILEGEHQITYQGEISECEHCRPVVAIWRHELNRNRFSFEQVEGHISELELDCGVHSVTLAYEPDFAWSTDRDWGTCSVRVSGDAGTTFTLVEYPSA